MTNTQALQVATHAVTYLAGEEAQIQRFMATTGLDLATIQQATRGPEFLVGVLDYLLEDESALLAFAQSSHVDPHAVRHARDHLAGQGHG